MADLADQADVLIYNNIERQLNKPRRTLIPVGFCHNCNEKLSSRQSGLLFCDIDCRDDYQSREKKSTNHRINN